MLNKSDHQKMSNWRFRYDFGKQKQLAAESIKDAATAKLAVLSTVGQGIFLFKIIIDDRLATITHHIKRLCDRRACLINAYSLWP